MDKKGCLFVLAIVGLLAGVGLFIAYAEAIVAVGVYVGGAMLGAGIFGAAISFGARAWRWLGASGLVALVGLLTMAAMGAAAAELAGNPARLAESEAARAREAEAAVATQTAIREQAAADLAAQEEAAEAEIAARDATIADRNEEIAELLSAIDRILGAGGGAGLWAMAQEAYQLQLIYVGLIVAAFLLGTGGGFLVKGAHPLASPLLALLTTFMVAAGVVCGWWALTDKNYIVSVIAGLNKNQQTLMLVNLGMIAEVSEALVKWAGAAIAAAVALWNWIIALKR